MLEKVRYRIWQVWKSLTGNLTSRDWDLIHSILTPEQIALFKKMTPGEQAHSVRVVRYLHSEGFQDPELLAAGLLHDVGKSRLPLSLWDRVWIVLVSGMPVDISPERKGKNRFWVRPLVVARQHPKWGSEMALSAGVTSLTAWLIAHHEREDIGNVEDSKKNRYLEALVQADNHS